MFNNLAILQGKKSQKSSYLKRNMIIIISDYFVSVQLHRHTVDSRGLVQEVETWLCSKYWPFPGDMTNGTILYFTHHRKEWRYTKMDEEFFFSHLCVTRLYRMLFNVPVISLSWSMRPYTLCELINKSIFLTLVKQRHPEHRSVNRLAHCTLEKIENYHYHSIEQGEWGLSKL